MDEPLEMQAKAQLVNLLGDEPVTVVEPGRRVPADFVIEARHFRLLAEVKRAGAVAVVDGAAHQLSTYLSRNTAGTPKPEVGVVVVPFMTQAGRAACDRHEIGWLDLSGNADIQAPGVRILVQGRPNRFKTRGRPSNLFAPRSSRVARRLLQQPTVPRSQRWLAEHTGLSDGFVSRIVRGLEKQGLLRRAPGREVIVRDPQLMLEAWKEMYRFSKHEIIKGHIAARDGMDAARRIAEQLTANDRRFAATGLASAWCWNMFANFRVCTFYVEGASGAMLEEVGAREQERGANLWLVKPDDDAVFWSVSNREGIPCVGAIQTYLDLQGHPERAQEAAQELHRTAMPWSGP